MSPATPRAALGLRAATAVCLAARPAGSRPSLRRTCEGPRGNELSGRTWVSFRGYSRGPQVSFLAPRSFENTSRDTSSSPPRPSTTRTHGIKACCLFASHAPPGSESAWAATIAPPSRQTRITATPRRPSTRHRITASPIHAAPHHRVASFRANLCMDAPGRPLRLQRGTTLMLAGYSI